MYVCNKRIILNSFFLSQESSQIYNITICLFVQD